MTINVPEALETALKVQANAHGVSPEIYVRKLLEKELAIEPQRNVKPFKTGYGSFAKFGKAPSAEEIETNRADMFRGLGENF